MEREGLQIQGVKRPPKAHNIKCWMPFFGDLISGRKNNEVRWNDRNYQAGDFLLEQEWRQARGKYDVETDPLGYTGRFALFEITHVQELAGPPLDDMNCAAGWVVLSLSPVTYNEEVRLARDT